MPSQRALAPLLAALLALAPLGALGAQATRGSITGRVTEAGSGQPIPAAQVSVVGTNIGTQTGADGQFTLRGVSAGTAELRVLRVGFVEGRASVAVSAGQTATANVAMRSAPIMLTPMVTTATGEQRRIEVGNAVATIDVAKDVQERPVANVGDLLTARTPGVQVLPGTQTGNGTRVRIRGTSSLALTNNPIYVIDGVRVESSTGSSSMSVGGSTISRTVDLNPEEIENIEIVRGPSAATLYGTDAANGVIVITTKRGVAGRPRWTYYTEQTAITDRNEYPDAYRAWRTGTTATTNSTAANAVQCFLSQVASGACVQDSVTRYNLFKDKEATPYGVGYRQQQGLQLAGGSEAVRYFLHSEWETEDGVTKVPEFEKRYLSARNLSLLDEQQNPNALGRWTGRANLNLTLPHNAELAVGLSHVSEDIRLPMSDDSGVSGIGANVYGGPGFKYNLSPTGDTLYGYRQFTPRDIYQATTNQAIERTISSLNANWRPYEWLALRGNFGLDYTNRSETQLCRFQNCPDVGTDREGFKRDNRTNFYTYTVDAGATGTRRLSESIVSKTTAGVQYYRNIFDRNGAQGLSLPPGAVTVTAGATKAAEETSTETRTLGTFVEENVAFRDRLFLTAAVRSDRNSAFGTNFQRVFYPKFSASWVVSEEGFFHRPSWIDQLRLRSAYGASGVQPGPNDALPYYSTAVSRSESGDATGLVLTTFGNPNLKPERSEELELGIDGTWAGGRVSTEFTYYRKVSRDALVDRVIPPSSGTGNTTRLENVGQVSNRGVEALVTAQILRHRVFGWDVTINGSHNTNNLDSLGGLPPIVSSSTIQQRENYPLNGWWSRRLVSYEDKDKNGIITYNANQALSEIVVSDSVEFQGYSQPRTEIAFTNGFDLLNRRLRLSAMLDYKGGFMMYNNSERIRCSNRLNCDAIADKSTPLDRQAAAVMLREHPSRSVAGYFRPADFMRLRELSLTANLPESLVSRAIRGRNAALTLAARNLGLLWTKYDGVDPEATFSATGDAPSSFQAAAPPTYFTLRFTLGF